MTRARDVADTQDNVGGAVPPFAAGKNKIINGDFGIWQRGTSFSSPASGSYTADRWLVENNGTPTTTISQQTFTAGTAPVAGYEGQFFLRCAMTTTGSATSWSFKQRIENVRTFANQSITISFWAKADSARTLNFNTLQSFGSGGSSDVFGSGSSASLTTSWQRFTYSTSIASVSGKTIGANSYLMLYFDLPISSTTTVDIWGVQVEAGSVATPFQTATGTLAGELAACQRYYYRQTADATAVYAHLGYARGDSATVSIGDTPLPVTMRVTPTSVDYSNVAVTDGAAVYAATSISLTGNQSNAKFAAYQLNHASGVTQFRYYYVVSNNNSAGYLGFSAEL